MSHKVFPLPAPEELPAGPSFTIKGTRKELKPAEGDAEPEWVDVEFTEDFQCLPTMPPASVTEYAVIAARTARWPVASIVIFIQAALIEEDEARFERLLRNKRVSIHSSYLLQIANFLSEEYAKRPTEPSTSSRRGRRRQKATSTGSSPSEDSK